MGLFILLSILFYARWYAASAAVGVMVIPSCPSNWTILVSLALHDPCNLATSFGKQPTCGGASFTIVNGSYYIPPERILNEIPPPCLCTNVMYNLISACEACRSLLWVDRTDFFWGCTEAPALYNFNSGDIAPWMSYEYTPSFNVTQAIQVAESLSEPTLTGVRTTTVSLVEGIPTSLSRSSSEVAVVGSVRVVVHAMILAFVVGFLIA